MKSKLGSLRGLVVIGLFSLVACLACTVDGTTGTSTTETEPSVAAITPSLTVANNSSSALCFVRWTDGTGQQHSFAADSVYDATLQKTVAGLLPGSQATLDVKAGSNPLVFFFADGGTEYRTVASISVTSADAEVLFSLTDSTSIQINQ